VIKRVLVQITKVKDGLTLYGWRKSTVTDPLDTDEVGFVDSGSPGDGLEAPVAEGLGSVAPLLGVLGSETDDVIWLPEGSTAPTGYTQWMMNHSLVGTTAGDKKGRWGVCWVCQCEFPLSKMTRKNGKWYCREDAE